MVKILKASSNHKDEEKKNKKKKNKLQPDSIAMKKVKAIKSNPFETIWSRRKFDIIGKKRKGEERRLGLARSLAIQKRTKTLLKDYEQSGKSSVFVDKRIGEQTEGLPEFDKAIMRSQRERQMKLGKKNKYNLSDGEEDDDDEFEKSGFGSFPEKDDFEDDVPFENDEDRELGESEKRSAIIKHLSDHGSQGSLEAGPLEIDENRRKTKKEVMDELILKSKFFKAQKAKDKEENVEFLEQLDNNFTSLVNSEALLALTDPTKINALKALVNKGTSDSNEKRNGVSSGPKTVSLQQENPDSYDKLVNEMVLDRRARPSNRTKTPEEIAQEEKERLEHLEEERQKRMHAADDSSDEDGDISRDEDASTQRLRSVSGDDLGDSFTLDEERTTKLNWINDMLGNNVDEIEGEEVTSSEGSDNDGEDDDDDDDDDEENDEEKETYIYIYAYMFSRFFGVSRISSVFVNCNIIIKPNPKIFIPITCKTFPARRDLFVGRIMASGDQQFPPQKQDAQPGKEHVMDPNPKATSHEYKPANKLHGKVALVTGGDSGIGRAVCHCYAQEGATVAFTYVKGQEDKDAEDTLEMIRKAKTSEAKDPIAIPTDLGFDENCKKVVDEVVKAFGRIDVLVNNAAEQYKAASVEEIDEDRLLRVFRTNIFSCFLLTRHALKHMKEGSCIINTTSVNAYKGNAKLLDYTSTKGAIVAFTRGLALQLVEKGIRVNGVALGPIWTPLIPASFGEEETSKFGSQTPMKRAGQPIEVATAYVFLASNVDSSYYTGQVLHPNGGTIVNA